MGRGRGINLKFLLLIVLLLLIIVVNTWVFKLDLNLTAMNDIALCRKRRKNNSGIYLD